MFPSKGNRAFNSVRPLLARTVAVSGIGDPGSIRELRNRHQRCRLRPFTVLVHYGGVGRGNGVGRDRGVTLGVAVGGGVGVPDGVAVAVAVGVGDGDTVGVVVAVGVGVGDGGAPPAQNISVDASGVMPSMS